MIVIRSDISIKVLPTCSNICVSVGLQVLKMAVYNGIVSRSFSMYSKRIKQRCKQ